MRICVAARRDPTGDPYARALVHSLRSVGHDVTVVTTGRGTELPSATVRRVRADPSLLDKIRRRLTSGTDPLLGALQAEVAAARPDIVYPIRRDDVPLAAATEAMVLRRPEWPALGARDLIAAAPHDVAWSSSAHGRPAPFHLPDDDRNPSKPTADRHRGVVVAVAARLTPTNPSRYLVAALERAGVEVITLDGGIDWRRVPEETAAVVVVESPYPALEVSGPRKHVPLLFWVHHGEHHLPANLRLTHRYGADAILLAHSWHLAHRFPVPVHRFPFAVAPEVFDGGRDFERRRYDVAMVAAGLTAHSERYGRRFEMAQGLKNALGDRVAFRYGLKPREMAALYGNSRIVLNDGGMRHSPITMRVFETLGSGATLLTEDTPGTDVLLTPGRHYVALGEDPPAQVQAQLDSGAAEIAKAGREHALGRHTYDHRIDELLTIAAATDVRGVTAATPADPLSAVVDGDVEAQTLSVFGTALDLPDRAVRSGPDAVERLRSGTADAVVLAGSDLPDLDVVLGGARRYVYADAKAARRVERALEAAHPAAAITYPGGILRADLGAPGYTMRPDDHPLAT